MIERLGDLIATTTDFEINPDSGKWLYCQYPAHSSRKWFGNFSGLVIKTDYESRHGRAGDHGQVVNEVWEKFPIIPYGSFSRHVLMAAKLTGLSHKRIKELNGLTLEQLKEDLSL